VKRLAVLLLAIAPPAFGWGNAPDWVKAAAKTSLPAYPADTSGVVLLSETVTTVSESGEIRTVYRRATKILNTSGRELGYATAHFSALTRLASIHAWSIAPNGDEYEVKEREAVETALTDGTLYADQRAKVIRIPASDPGAVVAYEIELRTPNPDALQDSWTFQGALPVRLSRYTLVLPAGWTHQERWFNRAAAAPQASGGLTTWELRDVEAVKDEPRRPPMVAVAGRMAVNLLPASGAAAATQTWNDVGRWYTLLVQQRQAPTPELQARVRELTAGKVTVMDKIASLASFAQHDIRYVAIEIGIGGYQPHTAGEVFANRYGDCKDKVTALAAMLREIGVESYYVLASSDRGVIDRGFASMEGFDHAIIAIRLPDGVKPRPPAAVEHPKLGTLLLFDPTDATTPVGQLPFHLQQSLGLLVAGGGGDLIDLPLNRADANQLRRTAKLAIDANGTLSGAVTESRSGAVAAEMRALLATMAASERTRFVEHNVASSVADFKVTDVAIENLDDLGKDLVLRYLLSAQGYARKAGNLLLVRPRVLGRKTETLADLKDRVHGYATDGPSVLTDDLEIAAPAGVAVDELPLPAKIETADISYSSGTRFDGGVLRYHREFRVNSFVVARLALPELNAALGKIAVDERGSAVFKLP
jgi:transglutaminase-like putative cysteine protease